MSAMHTSPGGDPPLLLLDNGKALTPTQQPPPNSNTYASAGSYYEMLSQLGHHLEDLGSILVANSVVRGSTALDLVVTPNSCCNRSMSPCQSSRVRSGAMFLEPQALLAAQQELQERLEIVKDQIQAGTLLGEMKSSPPPPSPWLFDPAVAGCEQDFHDSAVAQASEPGNGNAEPSRPSADGLSPVALPASNRYNSTPSCTLIKERDTVPVRPAPQRRCSEVVLSTRIDNYSEVVASARADSARVRTTEPIPPTHVNFSVPTPAMEMHKRDQKKKMLIGNSRFQRRDREVKKKTTVQESGLLAAAIEPVVGTKEENPFQLQDMLVAVVILLNALVMGISADVDWEEGWQALEYIFTAFFVGEMMLKMRNFGVGEYLCGADMGWNVFDLIVVGIAIADITMGLVIKIAQAGDSVDLSKFTVVKLARLARLARLIRLLRFKMFKELKMMIQGVFSGLRVLIWAIILFFSFIYMLAMVMRNVYSGDEEWVYMSQSFGSVPWAMFTFFSCFTDGCAAHDGTPLVVHFYDRYGAYFMITYMLVFLFVSIGLFNLIMAIFVDNVMESTRARKMGQREKNHMLMEQRLRQVVVEVIKRGVKTLKKRKKAALKAGTNDRFSERLENPRRTMFGRHSGPRSWLSAKCATIKNGMKSLCAKSEKTKKEEDSDDEEIMEHDLPTDEDNSLIIERDLFNLLIEDPMMDEMLETLDICTSNRWELFDVLDADMSGNLDLEEMIVGLMNMRGPTEKADIVAVLLCCRHTMTMVNDMSDDFEHFVSWVGGQLYNMTSGLQALTQAQITPRDGHEGDSENSHLATARS